MPFWANPLNCSTHCNQRHWRDRQQWNVTFITFEYTLCRCIQSEAGQIWKKKNPEHHMWAGLSPVLAGGLGGAYVLVCDISVRMGSFGDRDIIMIFQQTLVLGWSIHIYWFLGGTLVMHIYIYSFVNMESEWYCNSVRHGAYMADNLIC